MTAYTHGVYKLKSRPKGNLTSGYFVIHRKTYTAHRGCAQGCLALHHFVDVEGRQHIETPASAARPKPRASVRVEVVVCVDKLRGADILKPCGAATHAAAGCTEDAEPKQSIRGGQSVHTNLSDGASTRDARFESAGEKWPGIPHPRAPAEEGQPVHAGRIDVLAEVWLPNSQIHVA